MYRSKNIKWFHKVIILILLIQMILLPIQEVYATGDDININSVITGVSESDTSAEDIEIDAQIVGELKQDTDKGTLLDEPQEDSLEATNDSELPSADTLIEDKYEINIAELEAMDAAMPVMSVEEGNSWFQRALMRRSATLQYTKVDYAATNLKSDGVTYTHNDFRTYILNGSPVFCIQEGIPAYLGTVYDDAVDLSNYITDTALREKLNLAVHYGYGQTTSYNSGANSVTAYCLTQLLVWELLGATNLSNTLPDYASFKADTLSKISSHSTRPSFDGSTITLKAGEQKVLSDTNSVVSNFTTVSSNGLTYSYSTDSLTISVPANTAVGTYIFTASKSAHSTSVSLVYIATGWQTLTQLGYYDSIPYNITVVVEPSTGEASIIKRNSATSEVVAGAHLVLTNSSGSVVDEWDTTSLAKSVTGLLAGTYTLTETKAPVGYKISNPVKVVITAGETTSVTILEDPIQGTLRIKKVDSVNGNTLTGAEFKLQRWDNAKDTYVDEPSYKFTYDVGSGYYVGAPLTWSSSNLGKFIVAEVTNPTGYSGTWSKAFVLSEDGQAFEYEVKNEPNNGKISIKKIDSVNGKLISGAVFKLQEWSKADRKYSDSGYSFTYDASKNTYNIDPIYYSQDNLGKFKIVETGNPYGYIGSWSKEIELAVDEEVFEYDVNNIQVRAKVTVSKLDRESGTNNAQGDTTLEGAVYGIYVAQDFTHPDGTIYSKGQVIQTQTTDKNGQLSFMNLLPYAYYVQEITPSRGYLLDSAEYSVDCTHDGTATSITKSLVVTEQVKKQAFELIKINSDGESGEVTLLEKAGFKIYLISDLIGVKNGTLTPAKGTSFTAGDFKEYDFSKDQTALYYNTGIGVNIPELFTDSKGDLVSPELAYGEYVVVETTVPDTYITIAPFLVTVIKDSRTPQTWRVFNDAAFETYLKIIKQDATTGETVLKAGAKYRILNTTTNEYIEQWSTYPTKTKLGTEKNPYSTNEEGYLITPEALKTGNYKIIEVEAPEGYVLNGFEGVLLNKYQAGNTVYTTNPESAITIDINAGVALLVDVESEITYVEAVQKNSPQLGKLNLYKYGEKVNNALTSVDAVESADEFAPYRFEYSKAAVEGAQFRVYANDVIYTQDNQGIIIFNKDTLIATLVTDSNGEAWLNNLPIGSYRLEEIVAGDGFTLNKEIKYFHITSLDDEIAFDFIDQSYKNERQKIEISIVKRDIETESLLAGAVFGLYTAEDMRNYSGDVIAQKDTLLSKAVTDARGRAIFDIDLPFGKYYAKELQVPNGYIDNNEIYYLNPIYKQVDQDIKKLALEVVVLNMPTEIEVSKAEINPKIDDDKTNFTSTGTDNMAAVAMEELIGAELAIIDKESDELFISWITGKETAIISRLTTETEYILRELNPPVGYVKADDIVFKLMVSGELLILQEDKWMKASENYIQMQDDYTKVEISKQDVVTGEEISGASLQIKNSEGIVVEEWISDGEPHLIERLGAGEYILVEVQAPGGYTIAEEMPFTVVPIDQVQYVVMKDDFYGSLQFVKTSEDDKLLSGGEFQLYSGEDTLIGTFVTDKNGEFQIDKLVRGDYYIKEKKAPEGYILDDKIHEFSISKANELVKLEVQNKALVQNEAVKTGDNNRLDFFVYLLIAGLVGISITILLKKKRRCNNKV